MRMSLLAIACVWAGTLAAADPTGADVQALVLPNPVLGADGRIALMLIEPMDGFSEELMAVDRDSVIEVVDETATPEGIILFAPNWTAAAFLAQGFGAEALSQRIAENEGTARGIDIATVPSAGAEPLHFYTVVPGAGGQDIPAECYARLFAAVIYAGGQPEAFYLPACLESMQ